jgi:sterol desaturase/sphingolipid hydroxylase (fatty acid hydroxylase superfamily)
VGFWVWATPKEIYKHSSSYLDMKLFIIGRLLYFFGAFNKVVFTTLIAGFVAGAFSTNLNSKLLANPILIAAIVMLVNDIVSYWMHRIYHQAPLFWPLHSVHHSAEVLTPITTYRQHPLAIVISTCVNSVSFGLLQGVFLGVFVTEFELTKLVGINIFYFGFLLLIHNFQHSHIWISFGNFWNHILISPAQHQIHHSLNPDHHDKNYGEVLAIWDWMFGTLYIPRTYEKITVGLADAKGRKLPQQHNGAAQAIIVPLRDIWNIAKSRRKNR